VKYLDAILGFVTLVGLAGLVLTRSDSVSKIASTAVGGVGYLTQVVSMRSAGQQLHF